MTISVRLATSRPPLHRVLVTIGVLVGILAFAPVVAGIGSAILGHGRAPQTAFASAPSGEYAVYATSTDTADTVRVAPAADPSESTAIARVDHLPGFYSRGAVSPDGSRVALVATDAGSVTRPGASLLVVNLETGGVQRVATRLDYLQTPTWTPDSAAVLAVRRTDTGKVTLLSVAADASGESALQSFAGVLGVYPLAFDRAGRLVLVVIDASGSTVYRDGEPLKHISTQITRDWELSPDGDQLAFVEASLAGGLQYVAQVVSLETGGVEAQALSVAGGQALGTAWEPGAADPTFGTEPVTAAGTALAQSLGGFDIPLAYSPTGASLAVERWTGASFADAGEARFEVVSGSGRTELAGASRFFGWAAR